MTATKIVYLLWAPANADPADRAACRDLLLRECAPKLQALRPVKLVAYVNDPESKVRLPSPFHPKDPPRICGQVDVWLDDPEQRGPYEQVLCAAGFRIAGYEVDESIYREYGGNAHSGPRSWPDGQRSPGIAMLTILERPARIPYDEWVRRWHGTMSPVSEAIQPRMRYVRNRVVRPLTAEAPDFAAMVVEAWPSKRHIQNPFRFYGAREPIGLVVNMIRILKAVTSFLELRRVRSSATGEYFLQTGFVAAQNGEAAGEAARPAGTSR